MIITEVPVNIQIDIRLNLALDAARIPSDTLPTADIGKLTREKFMAGLSMGEAQFRTSLTEQLNANMKQLKKGSSLSYDLVLSWIEQSKGKLYTTRMLQLSARSIDGQIQTATKKGEELRIRSVETPVAQLTINIETVR